MSEDEKTEWAPGEMADGSINIMTEEEARAAKILSDAEDEAFEALLDDDDLRSAYEAVGEEDEGEEE